MSQDFIAVPMIFNQAHIPKTVQVMRDRRGRRSDHLSNLVDTPFALCQCKNYFGVREIGEGLKDSWAVYRDAQACLDYILVLGEQHVYRGVRECVQHFNRARPHQGIEQKMPEEGRSKKSTGKIIAFPVVNGLHHDYRRAT
jgi:hypothetical protein